MQFRPFALSILAALFPLTLFAGTYSLGTHYPPVYIGNAPGCERGWYDPELVDVTVTENGVTRTDLRMFGQGNNKSLGYEVDSIYAMTRNANTGQWNNNVVNASQPANLEGNLGRCPIDVPGPLASPSIVRLAHSGSATGYRYYMAFVGGNADTYQGMIYWARSDDGLTWDVYRNTATGVFTPVVYGKYGDPCATHGVGQVQLAYENGLFYMFMQYWHRGGALSSEVFRFDYDPNHWYGFGPNVRQARDGSTWVANSGRLVFDYDTGAPDAGNTKLVLNDSVPMPYGFGAGDLKYNPARNTWLHVYSFGTTHVQEATSLAAMNFGAPQELAPTVLHGATPYDRNTCSVDEPAVLYEYSDDYYPGLWYGSVSGLPAQMWIYFPVEQKKSACEICGPWKTAMVPVMLNYNN